MNYGLILNCKSTIGAYLNYRLKGTKYLKGVRGGKKDIESLYRDMMNYYQDLITNPITISHLKFHFEDKMVNPYEICMIGMFLGIKPDDLAFYGKRLVRRTKDDADAKIIELYNKGKKYCEIAHILNCNRETVRKVVNTELERRNNDD